MHTGVQRTRQKTRDGDVTRYASATDCARPLMAPRMLTGIAEAGGEGVLLLLLLLGRELGEVWLLHILLGLGRLRVLQLVLLRLLRRDVLRRLLLLLLRGKLVLLERRCLPLATSFAALLQRLPTAAEVLCCAVIAHVYVLQAHV